MPGVRRGVGVGVRLGMGVGHPRHHAQRFRGILFRALGCSGLGFVALMSSFANRAVRGYSGDCTRPVSCVAPSLGRFSWIGMRHLAQRLPIAAHRASRHMVSKPGRVILGSASIIGNAGASTKTENDANSYTYSYLFHKKSDGFVMEDSALILLNTVIDSSVKYFLDNMWDKVTVVVCADGAANRLHDLSQRSVQDEKYIPDIVCGDLDSVRFDVAEYYKGKGVKILRVSDEGSNDLEKCLKIVQENHGVQNVILCGGLGGRFDHEMGNINAMYKNLNSFEQIVMLGDSSLIQILGPGLHRMKVDRDYLGPHCGIIPIGRDVDYVETKGLKWNLHGDSLTFGGLVSTSNIIVSDDVVISTTGSVVWTINLRSSCGGEY